MIPMIFLLGIDPYSEDYIEIAEEENDGNVTDSTMDYENDEVMCKLTKSSRSKWQEMTAIMRQISTLLNHKHLALSTFLQVL